jgi:hypothetical protein
VFLELVGNSGGGRWESPFSRGRVECQSGCGDWRLLYSIFYTVTFLGLV